MFRKLERRHYRKFFYVTGAVILVLGYHVAVPVMLVWSAVHFGIAVYLED